MSRCEEAGKQQRPGEDESWRTFVAVTPSAALREALGDVRSSLEGTPFARSLRWVPPENLHLTLRFLGPVPVAQLPALVSALRENLEGSQCFELSLQTIALFPNPRRPRALAALFAQSPALEALAARVEAVVRDSGLPAESRGFRPHLTLARFRRGRRPGPLPERSIQHVQTEVENVALVRSVLTPSGARYTTLEAFALSPASSLSR